ncbi:MAG: MCP four helix bundle domain-containing protein, partial [Cyclobacteriaceae bacterium]
AYNLRNKSKIAFWSAIILVIIFAKNWIDKKNVNTLNSSFTSVFDDRLVVESYIFQLSDHLYQKKIIIADCNNAEQALAIQPQVNSHSSTIYQILTDYEKTKLTAAESMYFGNLKERLQELHTLEGKFLTALTSQDHSNAHTTSLQMQKTFDVAMLDLNQLSKIQISEGRLLRDQSKQIAAGSTMLSQFELVVIVGIGILIQILIFASRSALPKSPQQLGLN